jgi:hypothetical protein
MVRHLWRVSNGSAYGRGMRRRRPPVVERERRPPDLDKWAGKWVAIKDGKVIAAAHNSRDLVPQVKAMGEAGKGAVAQFVPPPSDTIVIGVG